jgi:predicted DNA-binding protein with PD1-like motif
MRETESGLVILKLSDGEDVLGGLRERIEEHGIRSGLILSGIGMLRELTLGYFKGRGEYKRLKVDDPVELTSMQGNVGMSDEGEVLHVHITCGTAEGEVIGGHLISGRVNVVNEVVIFRLERTRLCRKLNSKTGLLELEISDR